MARKEASRRYPPIARLVADHAPRGRDAPVILDLGSGPALLLPEVAELVPRARLVAMDPSKAMLQLARRVLREAGPGTYEVLEGSAEAIPLPDGSVDVVVAIKNLHEWEDAPRGLSEVDRVLRPGGVFILRDSNKAYPYWKLRLFVALVRLTQGRSAVGKYLGPYQDAYRPDEVDDLLDSLGWTVLDADRRSIEFCYVARKG
jgi:ubiquinone/menaquinone biosynthesis C-methylase UbiE